MTGTSFPAYISTRSDGITLAVRVQPRASENAIGGEHGGELRLKVQAPPVDAAANEAVIRLLADVLDCPRSAIEIIRGHTGRRKVILIRGMAAGDAAKLLEPRG